MKYISSSLKFDPRGWNAAYKEEKNNLLYYLKDFKVAIKHIGATAYPGGMSNRNVDILITTTSMQDISSVQVRLESKGYKLLDSSSTDIVMLKSSRLVNGYGITIRIMEYASSIYNRYAAFEILLKENKHRITKYNKYRDDISVIYYTNFKKYQELKLNYINHLIDVHFKFE